MSRDFDAALIDLDGTLLDTVGDLAAATNRMLRALGRAECAPGQVATYIGKGIPRLVHRALTGDMSRDADAVTFDRAQAIFEAAYAAESGLSAVLFAGALEGLARFRAGGIKLACVTNKARRFTVELLERTALAEYFDVIVCGDDTAKRKPDPMPFVVACDRLHVAPHRALVIGDSANDMIGGRAAGCTVFAVPYGYNEGESVASLPADRIVASIDIAAQFVLGPNPEP